MASSRLKECNGMYLFDFCTVSCVNVLKMICNDFLVVKVNCP